MHDIVIIGGGLAGLAAANRLADLRVPSIVLEAGHYPAHKMCGEFLSPECLSILADWNIEQITPISRVHFQSGNTSYRLKLSQAAGGLSHLQLDPQLVRRASIKGVDVRTGVSVTEIKLPTSSDSFYTIALASGECLHARQIICATGRLPGLASPTPPPMRYVGFKAHFSHVAIDDELEMYPFSNGYLGLGPIEDGKVNCAALVRVDEKVTPQQMIQNHPILASRLLHAKMVMQEWMTCSIPEFGMKKTPAWPQAYFIGDAAGTIPPACGDGLAMAIASGYLVADYVVRQQDVAFKKVWQQHFARRIQVGKLFHHVLMNPLLTKMMIRTSQCLPFIPPLLFRLTRS